MIFQCADLVLLDKEVQTCLGKCQNGGVCVNGECVCRKGFSGTYCEIKEGPSTRSYFWQILILIILLLLIIIVIFITYKVYKQMNDGPPAHRIGGGSSERPNLNPSTGHRSFDDPYDPPLR